MSWCLMGKVKLLTNLAPLCLPSPDAALRSVKIPLCHCTHVWRSLYSSERPHKFCVAINYRHHGRHIWAYYHKASWEDISCNHYSVGSDKERFKMPTGFSFTPLLVLQSDQRRADRVCQLFLTTFLLYRQRQKTKDVKEKTGRQVPFSHKHFEVKRILFFSFYIIVFF